MGGIPSRDRSDGFEKRTQGTMPHKSGGKENPCEIDEPAELAEGVVNLPVGRMSRKYNKQESTKQNHRIQLFEKVEIRRDGSLDAMLHNDNRLNDSPETKNLIISSMSNFLFLEQDLQNDKKMQTLLRAFEREQFSGELAQTIITEGESGSKLYILEHGIVEIFINGEFIREMGRGAIFGELALLYDAPRSATVRCRTSPSEVVLWSLSRDIFKQIQVESSSSQQAQRARWLINSPDLAVLGAIDLSRLMATLHSQLYAKESLLYSPKRRSSECMVIEKGFVSIYGSEELEHASLAEIDRALTIVRPRGGQRYVGEKQKNPAMSGCHICDVNEGCILGTLKKYSILHSFSLNFIEIVQELTFFEARQTCQTLGTGTWTVRRFPSPQSLVAKCTLWASLLRSSRGCSARSAKPLSQSVQ